MIGLLLIAVMALYALPFIFLVRRVEPRRDGLRSVVSRIRARRHALQPSIHVRPAIPIASLAWALFAGIVLAPALYAEDGTIHTLERPKDGRPAAPYRYVLFREAQGFESTCRALRPLLNHVDFQPKCERSHHCRLDSSPPAGFETITMPEWHSIDPASNMDLVRTLDLFSRGSSWERPPRSPAELWQTQSRPVLEPAIQNGAVRLEWTEFDIDEDGNPEKVYRLDNRECISSTELKQCSMTLTPLDPETKRFDRSAWDNHHLATTLQVGDRRVWLDWHSLISSEVAHLAPERVRQKAIYYLSVYTRFRHMTSPRKEFPPVMLSRSIVCDFAAIWTEAP